jgi:phosphate acetyltransferase
MDIISSFKEKVRGKNFSVVLPEGGDERIILAARKIKDHGIAEPVVLGKPEEIEAAAVKAAVKLDGIKTINPKESDKVEAYAERYVKGREDMSAAAAKRMISKPVFYGSMMLAVGDTDAMVCGIAHATATVIQCATLAVGLMPGIETASSYFLMVIPDFQGEKNKPFIYADCAVNIDPTAEVLADIALASAQSAKKLLGQEPRVGMLSFSTRGSASAPTVDKVKKAVEIARSRQPNLAIDGEFQADSAIVPRVAAKKVKDASAVAGKANVLIFPDLDAGNIAYKLTQYMANAQAIGPFLQGFAKPVTDLSRGASADDVVSTAVLTLAQLL